MRWRKQGSRGTAMKGAGASRARPHSVSLSRAVPPSWAAPRPWPVTRLLVTRLLVICSLTLGLLRANSASAQPLEWQDTPPELRGWIPWVLDTLGTETCPKVDDQPVCVWPGLLQVDVLGSVGHFRQTVVVDRRTVVDLPGSMQAWPENVQINGTPGRVIDRSGAPGVELGKGAHTIDGDFYWSALPETLQVPARVALVSLRRDGVLVDFPKRDPNLLWLRASSSGSDEPQRLSLEVFRKLHDAVPFQVSTQLALRVGGKARELNLGRITLPGSTPLSIESALPVRLNEDQTLSVQVYAGTHTILLESLFASPPQALTDTPHPEPWPESETWVFEPDAALRQAEISGAPAVDPNRTNLPDAWRRLAAYTVTPGTTLAIATLRRGEPESPPNRLDLQRDIFLDLDGGACTIRDHWTGQMTRSWRMDLLQGDLGRVLVHGEAQLITTNPVSGHSGVELRDNALDMVAEWRFNGSLRQLPAVGWSEDVQSLQTTVRVPPGWQLISASGVDGVSETWLSSWNLFSLFFVLIVSIAIGQLTHYSWGALALIAMFLTHDQTDAPLGLWAGLVACIALLRVLPRGKLRWLCNATTTVVGAVLLVTLAHYSITEVRAAAHPQAVDEDSTALDFTSELDREADSATSSGGRYAWKGGSLGGEPAKPPRAMVQQAVQQQQDPSAVVQTGPGVPTWNWHSWQLTWSGPVQRSHSLNLYLLSPGGGRLISGLRVGLCGLLGFLLLRFALEHIRRPPSARRRRSPAAPSAVALLVALGLASPRSAHAELPSKETLDELRERITRKPLCDPTCVSVQNMDVTISGRDLTVGSEVHVTSDDSVQLPGPLQSWAPAEVTINGTPAAGMYFADDGFLHLRLPPGRYRVQVKGPIAGNNLTLSLGEKPHRVSVNAEDWNVDGVSEVGAVDGSLGFHRKAEAHAQSEPRELTLPSWLLVTRTLQLGVSWTINTHVERVGPVGSPLVQRFALLPGEQVTRADLSVEHGNAVVSLGRDQTELSFDSVLRQGPEIQLVAQRGERLSERWVLQCGPIWRCETEGIAPISPQNQGPRSPAAHAGGVRPDEAHWEPHYYPWPEDRLLIRPVRPAAAAGASTTIDEAHLDLIPGTRLLNAKLGARVRSSSRSTLNIGLPPGAELQQLLLDGEPHAAQTLDGKLQVTLDPGEHSLNVDWQEPGGIKLLFQAPAVTLGAQAVNVSVNLQLPEDRWLLLVGGPRWGPAILFWGYFVFVLLVSTFVLARLPRSPLREWQWIALGVGLSQISAVVFALIVAWFFAFALLDHWRPRTIFKYNATQVLLAIGTLVFLGCLFAAVYNGLLSRPDMDVHGAGSTNHSLTWYVDRTTGALPQPWTITTSLWVWRGAMLTWSLWLASSLLGWLRWSWALFTRDGLWLRKLANLGPNPGMASQATPPSESVRGVEWAVTNHPVSSRPPRSSSRPPVQEYFPNSAATDEGAEGDELEGSPATPRVVSQPDGEKGPPTLPTGSVAPEQPVVTTVSAEANVQAPAAGADPNVPELPGLKPPAGNDVVIEEAVASGPRERDPFLVPSLEFGPTGKPRSPEPDIDAEADAPSTIAPEPSSVGRPLTDPSLPAEGPAKTEEPNRAAPETTTDQTPEPSPEPPKT